MSNTLDLTNIQTTRTDTMNDIAELQNLERTYFNNLQTSVATKTLSDSEKDDLIDKINEISQIRVNLYKSLGQAYNFYQNNISSTHDTMREQAIAIYIVDPSSLISEIIIQVYLHVEHLVLLLLNSIGLNGPSTYEPSIKA